mmetsp:Transcript_23186/g.45233  ORF Transcript_23186/g.45233 Transcript_23186/m.45233 type:complete len:86 (+) Transcript_23186:2133-2390(+)
MGCVQAFGHAACFEAKASTWGPSRSLVLGLPCGCTAGLFDEYSKASKIKGFPVLGLSRRGFMRDLSVRVTQKQVLRSSLTEFLEK